MTERRSPDRLAFHYRVEKDLAARLKSAPRAERLRLYGPLYDELFRTVEDHPQHTQHADRSLRGRAVREQIENLRPWLTPASHFLELGAGDCEVSAAAARLVNRAWALDVSEVITGLATLPPNLQRILSDGIQINLPDASIDVAYSHQLIEHLHPDDVVAQVEEVRRVLRPGGTYLVVTPSRLSGPHDISGFFDEVATGFHLREYSVRELKELMERCGFECPSVVAQISGRRVELPMRAALALEATIEALPRAVARRTLQRRPLRWVLNTVQVVARKPSR